MDEAIETATLNLKKKLEKAHMKHNSVEKGKTKEPPMSLLKIDIKNCSLCQKMEVELESGRRSPIVMSPTTSAKFQRRRGVSERSAIEGQLVREAMKVVSVNENIDTWGFNAVPCENN